MEGSSCCPPAPPTCPRNSKRRNLAQTGLNRGSWGACGRRGPRRTVGQRARLPRVGIVVPIRPARVQRHFSEVGGNARSWIDKNTRIVAQGPARVKCAPSGGESLTHWLSSCTLTCLLHLDVCVSGKPAGEDSPNRPRSEKSLSAAAATHPDWREWC